MLSSLWKPSTMNQLSKAAWQWPCKNIQKHASELKEKPLAGSHVGTVAACVPDNLYMDLEIDNHILYKISEVSLSLGA